MPTGKEIPNKFCVNREDYDCIIQIHMTSHNKELLQYLMNTIDFNIHPDVCQYEFHATAPIPNTTTLDRNIFVKKKE